MAKNNPKEMIICLNYEIHFPISKDKWTCSYRDYFHEAIKQIQEGKIDLNKLDNLYHKGSPSYGGTNTNCAFS